jgi:hypothetical protein
MSDLLSYAHLEIGRYSFDVHKKDQGSRSGVYFALKAMNGDVVLNANQCLFSSSVQTQLPPTILIAEGDVFFGDFVELGPITEESTGFLICYKYPF